jgi:signal transduction histidine kinase
VLTRIEHQLKLASLTSALRTRNQELEEAKLRLEELDRLKSRFAAMLVHDLRNPLGAVRLGLESTIDEPGDLSYLPKCVTEINKCLSFLNELLEVYRTEARGMDLQVGTVEPRNLLNSTLDTFQMMAVDKGITLRREIEDNLPVIQGDMVRLDRVFANLLGNAMKFTPKDGSITLCADVQEGEGVDEGRQWLRVRVIDTGRGIPPQELPFVFDPYRQAMVKDSAHGAGLGLAIVSNIVAAHMGRITVQSQEGVGSCFTVLLPCNLHNLVPCISKP